MYRKVTIKGMAGMAVSPAPGSPLLAVWTPEAKGQPATAGVYDYTSGEPAPIVKKAFFRTQGAAWAWAHVALNIIRPCGVA